MLDKEAAISLALAHISKSWGMPDAHPVILDDMTIVKDFGWVFFYDSSKHLETGVFEDSIVGNAPVIVNKHDGSLHFTGTGRPIEDFVKAYERTGDPFADEVEARQL